MAEVGVGNFGFDAGVTMPTVQLTDLRVRMASIDTLITSGADEFNVYSYANS